MATESSSVIDAIQNDSLGLLIQSSIAEQENRDNLQKAIQVADRISFLASTSGQDKAAIARSQAAAELGAQKNKLKIANAAGRDPSAAMDSLLETISQLQTTQAETRKNLIDLQNKTEQGIFHGNPINWIENAIDLHKTQERVDLGVKSTQILTQQVDQVNNVIQQSAITENAIKQSLTEADIEANNRLILNDAETKSAQADLDALKFNSQLINNAKEASKERLGALYNLRQSQVTEEQLKRSLEALQLSKEEFEWRKQEKAVTEQARADGKEVDSYITEMISKGRAARGASPLDSKGMKTMLQMFKSGGAGSKELYTDYQNGERTNIAGIPMLGATPAESLNTLQMLGTTVAAVREETIALLKDAKAATEQNKQLDPKNKEAVAEDFNKNVNTLVKNQFATIKPGSGNIFDVGDLRTYLGNSTDDKMGVSTMKNLAISQKLLIPAIEANQPMNDPSTVIKLAIAAVKKGTITSSEYLELADVYRRANEINQASLNLTGLGIVAPNNGKNYFIKPGTFEDRLDVADPIALSRYLSVELASPFTAKGAFKRNPFGLSN